MKNFKFDRIRRFQRRVLDWVVTHHPSLKLDERSEFFVRLFEKHLPAGSRVLDVGGGWGFYEKPLRRRGHFPVVLDVTRPGYQKAPVVLYSGGRFPFPDKSFDVSLLVTVLHHTENPEAVLKEVMRVTRKTLIVVEDLYRHRLGRFWTKLRDQFYNMEFFGHPAQFRRGDDWVSFLSGFGLVLESRREVYTWLSGLRILNGLFVFRVPS